MSFKEQLNNSAEGFKSDIFLPDIRYKAMTGKGAISFRILPSHNYEDVIKHPQTGEDTVNPAGWLPFMLPDGTPTDWAAYAYIARFAGHGTYKAQTRFDFVCWDSFDAGDKDACPYRQLLKRASTDPDFKIMTEDIKGPDGKTVEERATLPRPAQNLVANIVDINETEKGVLLALFSTSAAKSLITPTGGLANRMAGNATDEQIQGNYLVQWACGDLTDPTSGPVLLCVKGTDRGDMSGYEVDLAHDAAGRVRRWALKPMDGLLRSRHFLIDPHRYLLRREKEDAVKLFVSMMNNRLPNGHHEWELLKEVFAGSGYDSLIPSIASAPGAQHTVQGASVNAALSPSATFRKFTPPVKPIQDTMSNSTVQDNAPEQDDSTEDGVKADVKAKGTPAMIPGTLKGFDRNAFLNSIKGKA